MDGVMTVQPTRREIQMKVENATSQSVNKEKIRLVDFKNIDKNYYIRDDHFLTSSKSRPILTKVPMSSPISKA